MKKDREEAEEEKDHGRREPKKHTDSQLGKEAKRCRSHNEGGEEENEEEERGGDMLNEEELQERGTEEEMAKEDRGKIDEEEEEEEEEEEVSKEERGKEEEMAKDDEEQEDGKGEGEGAALSEDVMEHVLSFITCHRDRNAVSLVCRSWNVLEASGRRSVFIGNCYAVSPQRATERFTRFSSLILKGKPRFADFDLLPRHWGAFVEPWIHALSVSHHRFLQDLRLKRMTLSDHALHLLSHSFPHFNVLVLTSCDGFSTHGLASIAANCRSLTHLELTENTLHSKSGAWISAFPPGFTSLVSLDFEDLEHEVDFHALESLITRCTGLKTLKLNRSVTVGHLRHILSKNPNLSVLGTGSFSPSMSREEFLDACNVFRGCKKLHTLSGFWVVAPGYLSVINPIGANLVAVNLSYSPICDGELADLVSQCHHICKLWLMDTVEDKGLQAVASSCKDLKDFRVYPATREGQGQGVTEEGLTYIANGCRNLRSILYFCNQMTNSAVEIMARNCVTLESFRLCIMDPAKPDHVTNEPMDDGFGEIVKHCKELRRLSLSGLLTDKAFEYIGMYGKKLERLSVAFAGESDVGLQHVLRGCVNLKKLEIRDSPFGDMALLSGIHRYEAMRSLWMSNCNVTIGGCQWLAHQKPRLNVEVVQRNNGDNTTTFVESVYVYRSVAGHRNDRPHFVMSL